MRIEYTGRHADIPAEVKALAERKLAKLAKLLPGITDVHVVVVSDKRRHTAEISVHSPHLTLTAARESGDLGGSLAAVIDKLARQAQHHIGKRRRMKRGPKIATAPRAGSAAPAEKSPRVIRVRRWAAKPMTVEDAVIVVASSPNGFVIFRDAATERMSVLYRRKDGNLGLIEPEA